MATYNGNSNIWKQCADKFVYVDIVMLKSLQFDVEVKQFITII